MSSLISSSDLLTMILSIELQSLSLYTLASLYRESELASSAGLKYFLLGSLSSSFILLGSSLLYGFTGVTSLTDTPVYLAQSMICLSHGGIALGFILIAIGLLFKVAAAPFHNWAPDVYDGVPTLVTSWLAVMPKISILIFLLTPLHTFTHIAYWDSFCGYVLWLESLPNTFTDNAVQVDELTIHPFTADDMAWYI
jgi:NADH-ubiquinone oxidoreductase chain 2